MTIAGKQREDGDKWCRVFFPAGGAGPGFRYQRDRDDRQSGNPVNVNFPGGEEKEWIPSWQSRVDLLNEKALGRED